MAHAHELVREISPGPDSGDLREISARVVNSHETCTLDAAHDAVDRHHHEDDDHGDVGGDQSQSEPASECAYSSGPR